MNEYETYVKLFRAYANANDPEGFFEDHIDPLLEELDERDALIKDLRAELAAVTPKSIVHSCCEEVVELRQRLDAQQ